MIQESKKFQKYYIFSVVFVLVMFVLTSVLQMSYNMAFRTLFIMGGINLLGVVIIGLTNPKEK